MEGKIKSQGIGITDVPIDYPPRKHQIAEIPVTEKGCGKKT